MSSQIKKLFIIGSILLTTLILLLSIRYQCLAIFCLKKTSNVDSNITVQEPEKISLNTNKKTYITLSGSYNIYQGENGLGVNNGDLTFTIDDSEITKIPLTKLYEGDKGTYLNYLGFYNEEEAKKILNTNCSPTGKAVILIKDYKVQGTDDTPKASFENVVNLLPDDKNCKSI